MLVRARGWLDRYANWRALAVVAALIFGLSSIPNNFEPSESAIPADKIAHASEFGALSLILAWCLARWRGSKVTAVLAAMALIGSAAYGLTDELHQSYVPGRDVTAGDLAADIAGAAVGVCFALLVSNRR